MKKILAIIVAILAVSLLPGCIVLRVKDGGHNSEQVFCNEDGSFCYTEEYAPPEPIPMVQYCAPVLRIFGGRAFWVKECEWRQEPAYNPGYGYNYGYGVNVNIGNIHPKKSGHYYHKNKEGHKNKRGGKHKPGKGGKGRNHNKKEREGRHR